MTPEELTRFKNLLEAAKILRACVRNVLYEHAPSEWPDGWGMNKDERMTVEAAIKEAQDFVKANQWCGK